MRLSGRVKTLERRSGAVGPCPQCGGQGMCGTAMRINGVEHARYGGCPRCGRFSSLKVVVLNYESQERAEEARRMWGE